MSTTNAAEQVKPRRRHRWREAVCETFYLDTITWEQRAEAEALGYPTELREFAERHPRPTLKKAMLALAGRAPEIYADVESEAA